MKIMLYNLMSYYTDLVVMGGLLSRPVRPRDPRGQGIETMQNIYKESQNDHKGIQNLSSV